MLKQSPERRVLTTVERKQTCPEDFPGLILAWPGVCKYWPMLCSGRRMCWLVGWGLCRRVVLLGPGLRYLCVSLRTAPPCVLRRG